MIHDVEDTYAILPSYVRPRRIQPGKRTIFVSLLLSFMLLISQVFRALQLNEPPKLTNVHITQSLTNLNEERETPTCLKTFLGTQPPPRSSNPQSCRHLPAPRGICSLTQQLFFSTPPPSCQHQHKVTFCVLKAGQVSCGSPSECTHLKHYIGVFEEDEADVRWKHVKIQDLQISVMSEVKKKDFLGFVYLKCSNSTVLPEDLGQPQYDDANAYEDTDFSYSQLFLYPPTLPTVPPVGRMKRKYINLNFVLIDSLSRTHFYRSLPKTVGFLEEINRGSESEVLDFQFVQAVKHRTYENLQALFSGFVNTTEHPFGTYDVPKRPLPLSQFFGDCKKNGYRTLWLEDLCWSWEWGITKDLKVVNKSLSHVELWQNFKRALGDAHIDSVDITVASCAILSMNGKKDPFHGLPAVCFNGQHHHEYILEYLELYQKARRTAHQHFLTFSSLNVAHEETGVRVQAMDEPLVKYLKFASKLENTITILFSDHGNTYGKFIQQSPEAYAEIYNPSFFMIVPQDVQNILGAVHMHILKGNENRLISLIDIYYMLMELIDEKAPVTDKRFVEKYVVPGGLLSNIPVKRTCNDIPILQPTLCICRNYETVVEPQHNHMALADFGLGVLNGLILSQNRDGGGTGFGNCRPLRPQYLRKVRETRITADLVRYKLDIVVDGIGVEDDSDKELFFLTLEAGEGDPTLRLTSYDRMSIYDIYSSCQDRGVELKLCICKSADQNQEVNLLNSLIFGNLLPQLSFFKQDMSEQSNIQMIEFLTNPIWDIKPQIGLVYPSNDPCLFTVVHTYKSGVILLAANLCKKFHKIELDVQTENLNLSTSKHASFLLHANDVKLLIGGVVANPKVDWHWNYDIKVY